MPIHSGGANQLPLAHCSRSSKSARVFPPMLLSAILFLIVQNNGISVVQAASKILVFSPTLSRSHMISNGRLADVLAKDGHNVTLLEVEFVEPVNLVNASKLAGTIKVSGNFFRLYANGMSMHELVGKKAFDPPSALKSYVMAGMFNGLTNDACERFFLRESELLARLKAERFDFIFAEQLNLCGAGLKHVLNIRTHILLSSCPLQEHIASILGLPFPSSYVPSLIDSGFHDRMSLLERFHNLMYQFAAHAYITHGVDPLTQKFRRHFGANFPDLKEIVRESPFVFVAVDELVDFPRPVFPNIVYIGGLGVADEMAEATKRPLPEPFRSEMSKGGRGVIYFSMGSILHTTDLDERFRRNVLMAFAQLPEYHFIVRIEKDDNFCAEIAKHLENVFITPWVPQAEMLVHPRLKLFISHGGYNSLMEAARAGVPLLAMGFFADQQRNALVAQRNGWGLAFDKSVLLENANEFRAAILRVVQDPKYEANAKRTQKLVLTKPFSAEERLIKNIRFLELNGGQLPELLSESRNMNTIALYNLDIFALAATVAVFIFMIGTWIMAWAWRRLRRVMMKAKKE